VLDPACGSGAFLVRVFDVLLEEHIRVQKILESEKNQQTFISEEEKSALYKNILTNNIYGVDLNEESVEITKLSLWLKSAQKNKKLTSLDNNIKCGNSLIDDETVAGEKAFKREEKFKEIMAS
jgi:type II restriction/modification system DNA methylase subunit YeeA